MRRRWAWVILGATAACSGGDATPSARPANTRSDSSGGEVVLPQADYSPSNVATTGSIAGTVALEAAVLDTVASTESCAGKIQSDSALDGRVVVWIADVKQGKAISIEKRTELTSEGCDLY